MLWSYNVGRGRDQCIIAPFFATSRELDALRSSNGARSFGAGVLVSQTAPIKEIAGAPGSVWFVFVDVRLLHNGRRMLAGCLSTLLAA